MSMEKKVIENGDLFKLSLTITDSMIVITQKSHIGERYIAVDSLSVQELIDCLQELNIKIQQG